MNNEKKPYQIVNAVTDIFDNGRKVDSKWVRIGAMFENRDGTYSILLEALPLDWTRVKLVTTYPKARERNIEEAEQA